MTRRRPDRYALMQYATPPTDAALSAREMLVRTEACMGLGDSGDTLLARWAQATLSQAEREGDGLSEVLARFYLLIGQVQGSDPAVLTPQIDAAIARCRALNQPRGQWLMDDLRLWMALNQGRHVEAIALGERTLRRHTAERPPFERSMTVYYLSFAYEWGGRLDDAQRVRHQLLALAEQAGRPIWLASACVALGAFLTSATFNPEAGLPHLQRARSIWADHAVHPWALVATAQTVLALSMLDRHDEAHEVLRTDLAREGAMALVGPYRARLSTALIGVGRLDEAEAWLDAARAHRPGSGNWAEPLMRVQLRCAQQRYAEARQLAEAELNRQRLHSPTIYDHVRLLDLLRTACEALGDQAAAQQAAEAARQAYQPLLGLSLRARYVSEQASAAPGDLPDLTPRDLRRLHELQRAVEAHAPPPDAGTGPVAAADDPVDPTAPPPSPQVPQVPRFLSHVVHELRNPIGGVLGLSSLLLMSRLDAEQRRHATALQSSANTLLQLVNDVLDLAKIEHGHFDLHCQPLALRPWLAEVVAPYAAQGERQGLPVFTSLQEPLPDSVVADPMRLRQIVAKLLSNALKFTRSGRVDVSLAAMPLPGEPAGRWQLHLAVQDTGLGIAEAARGRLFEEFSQADAQGTGEPGGTGLGLALCRQLVRHMGGEIGVSSQPGHGSRFWFTVEVGSPADPAVA